jgi:hypothetical protein
MTQIAIILATLLGVADLPASVEPSTVEASAVQPVPTLTASYDSRFLLQIPASKFSLQPILFLQTLFSLPRNAALDQSYEGTGFSFRRAGVGIDARVEDWGRVFFLANVASGSMALWDFFTDIEILDEPGLLIFRAGRFRPWLCRQRLAAGDHFQMIQFPRVITDFLDIGDGRDLGMGAFGLYDSKLEYGAGVWNGEQNYQLASTGKVGDRIIRGNLDFEVGGRIVYHPLGYLSAVDESDLAYSTAPRLAVGVSAMYNRRHDQQLPNYDPTAGLSDAQRRMFVDDRVLKVGFEAAFRYQGLSIEAEAFLRKVWLAGSVGNDQFNSLGVGDLGRAAYIQGGYFLLPHKLEATGRFEFVDVEPASPGYMLHPTAGLNYFLRGYNLLLQFMYRTNVGVGFDSYDAYWRSAKPALRYTTAPSLDRPLSRITHEIYFMLQASL